MNSNLDTVLSGTSGSFRLPLLGLLLPVLDLRGSGFCFNKGSDSSQIPMSMESLCIGPQTLSFLSFPQSYDVSLFSFTLYKRNQPKGMEAFSGLILI